MKIELKNFKSSSFAPEETLCYQATIYIDGAKVAQADNSGKGGMTMIHLIDLSKREVLAEARKNIVAVCKENSKVYGVELEDYVDYLAYQKLAEKELKNAMRNKVVFQKPDGEIYYASVRGAKLTESMVEQYQRENPTFKVLNLMPFDNALEIFTALPQE